MTEPFDSIEAALMALSNPGSPDWGDAFRWLSSHPDTAALMQDVFRETLEQMGIEPSEIDPVSGEPSYSLADVARALGASEDELDLAVQQAKAAVTNLRPD
jgi:hypothetical protein